MYNSVERFGKPSMEFVKVSCNIHRLQFSKSREELKSFTKYLSQLVRVEQHILGVLFIQYLMH